MHLGRGERLPAAVSDAGYRDVARRPLLWQIKVKSWKRLEIAGNTYTNIHERHCTETRHKSATCMLRAGALGKADIDLPHQPAQMSISSCSSSQLRLRVLKQVHAPPLSFSRIETCERGDRSTALPACTRSWEGF